eukprot:CAMPEP_0195280124 /NCGR_PEP_ID=MMETSP0706-20130129/20885_1 /TAXON_ID=33640 /ORGANISM="Asterionellopsis glacialis, Strain CCMP134" /LENGTH=154 /DNA_ID=CAMNT_0040338779 /DNA_START=1 /DNA_END=465 /DNA_ORIENTATION=-
MLFNLEGTQKQLFSEWGFAKSPSFPKDETFMQSCGMADLITTCYGGRNRKCAEAFAISRLTCDEEKKDEGNNFQIDPDMECQNMWDKIESDLLNGQKLQGTPAAKEVHALLSSRNLLQTFPLMDTIFQIAFKGQPIDTIVEGIIDVPREMNSNL